MANIIEVHDLAAPELTLFSHLTEAQLRNRSDPEKGIFIAESSKVIKLALKYGCKPLAFLMERKRITGQAQDIIRECGDVSIYTGDRELLAKLTGYKLTRGILCALTRPKLAAAENLITKARRIAVLDGITDSTNVGAIFRSAAALGMDAILITPSCCDPLCRRSVRVSMGTIFQLPWARIGEDISILRTWGFKTVAMALNLDSVGIEDKKLAAEKRLALIFGSEGYGLSSAVIAACDYAVKIPMAHQVDSLNVAAASAVAFWQLRI
ncbi:TrmH family RNA methyltransferase [Pectinatus haikarae]|uniref:tRNA G18 (Ribose-2'-O)-methylase SpoU n=1 Tax=Pectinatus haikarae TaxID=349096 RepID=A0ABT9Y7C3_9FIRM|nr:RNA methyltransferase [Pectinatus haikarae]MDQ0203736.1 tRNA G18 (ribose-2'-O)-methylase SpoU [Pectinatus haikarae]